MVAEHTWGRDVKTYLKDWDIYLPIDFKEARQKPNFKQMEQSWKEKRRYIDHAINNLPSEEKQEALAVLKALKPSVPPKIDYKEIVNRQLSKQNIMILELMLLMALLFP